VSPQEYAEVLERLRVRSARTIVALIREQGQLVHILKKIPNLPDRDDAPCCECAESADADFIVTLNPSDFPQGRLKAKVIHRAIRLHCGVERRSRAAAVS
jgi:hypothetical protein